eukprot:g3727.t1
MANSVPDETVRANMNAVHAQLQERNAAAAEQRSLHRERPDETVSANMNAVHAQIQERNAAAAEQRSLNRERALRRARVNLFADSRSHALRRVRNEAENYLNPERADHIDFCKSKPSVCKQVEKGDAKSCDYSPYSNPETSYFATSEFSKVAESLHIVTRQVDPKVTDDSPKSDRRVAFGKVALNVMENFNAYIIPALEETDDTDVHKQILKRRLSVKQWEYMKPDDDAPASPDGDADSSGNIGPGVDASGLFKSMMSTVSQGIVLNGCRRLDDMGRQTKYNNKLGVSFPLHGIDAQETDQAIWWLPQEKASLGIGEDCKTDHPEPEKEVDVDLTLGVMIGTAINSYLRDQGTPNEGTKIFGIPISKALIKLVLDENYTITKDSDIMKAMMRRWYDKMSEYAKSYQFYRKPPLPLQSKRCLPSIEGVECETKEYAWSDAEGTNDEIDAHAKEQCIGDSGDSYCHWSFEGDWRLWVQLDVALGPASDPDDLEDVGKKLLDDGLLLNCSNDFPLEDCNNSFILTEAKNESETTVTVRSIDADPDSVKKLKVGDKVTSDSDAIPKDTVISEIDLSNEPVTVTLSQGLSKQLSGGTVLHARRPGSNLNCKDFMPIAFEAHNYSFEPVIREPFNAYNEENRKEQATNFFTHYIRTCATNLANPGSEWGIRIGEFRKGIKMALTDDQEHLLFDKLVDEEYFEKSNNFVVDETKWNSEGEWLQERANRLYDALSSDYSCKTEWKINFSWNPSRTESEPEKRELEKNVEDGIRNLTCGEKEWLLKYWTASLSMPERGLKYIFLPLDPDTRNKSHLRSHTCFNSLEDKFAHSSSAEFMEKVRSTREWNGDSDSYGTA